MGNYKIGSRRKITIAGLQTPIPNVGNAFYLYDMVAGSNAADGMMDVDTNAIYQVAAARTLRILGVRLTSLGTAAETVVISSGDTENAETAGILTLQIPTIADLPVWMSVEKTLAGSKFLTYNPSGTGLSIIEIVGYEE